LKKMAKMKQKQLTNIVSGGCGDQARGGY